ncbi:MAG: hypothetical protein JWR19_1676 [Pedosphaera sp.]|nr:hypothetical protein [Pedosphaera sp.]
MKLCVLGLTLAMILCATIRARAAVYRMLTGDYTTINPDWSAYENGRSFDTVESGSPLQPLISTQHFAGSNSIQIQVPTDTCGSKERFEYTIAHASDPDGLHFDNARYCGFAFKLGSPSAAFNSSDLFWQAWQGSPWGPPASLKLTAGSSAPYTVGLYIRNMVTGPDSAVSDVKLWSSPMVQPDTWYTVVIYIAPRFTNNNGNIKLWINRTNYVNCTTNIGYDPNLVAGAYNGLDIKNGMYQPDANNGHTMYFDQIMVADTYVEAAGTPLPTNTPPTATASNATILRNTFAEVDLATLVHDSESAATQCLYSVNATNGTAMLLADGHTARYTPAVNFFGTANYTYIVSDQGEDPREFLHYSFEPPDSTDENFVTDNSGHFRDGNLLAMGAGTFSHSTNVPPSTGNVASLQLTKSGTGNAARLTRFISNPAELNLSESSWTFSGWFQRETTTGHDFLFYIGNGDGFGGDGDELQFYCPVGNATLAVQHYNTNNVLDVNVSSPASATTGQWHHAALVFQSTNTNSGVLRAYLNGTQFAMTNVTWTLPRQMPIVFGGHNKTNANVNRWFNGCLDDLAIFTNALSAAEVSRLATRTVSQFGGFSATNSVNITVTNFVSPRLSNVALTNGTWSMLVSGDSGANYTIQTSTDLIHWTALLITNPATLPFYFGEPLSSSPSSQFYRVEIGP